MSVQLSKKDFFKKKPQHDDAHWEGKLFCSCRIRNKRKWLGNKKFGNTKNEGDIC